MQTKNLFKVSVATLALGVLAGCQTVQQPAETPVTPVGQSTSTVQITNQTGFGETATQQKLVKPFDGSLPQADVDAFNKADAAKNPELCNSITTEAYKKFCLDRAADKNAPPLKAESQAQENCKSTTADQNTGVKNCINYEE